MKRRQPSNEAELGRPQLVVDRSIIKHKIYKDTQNLFFKKKTHTISRKNNVLKGVY